LVPWWVKYTNVNGDYMAVRCVPSATHVPCKHLSQNEVIGIRVFATLFSKLFVELRICQHTFVSATDTNTQSARQTWKIRLCLYSNVQLHLYITTIIHVKYAQPLQQDRDSSGRMQNFLTTHNGGHFFALRHIILPE
jgi:hypothetical protein